MKVVNLTEENTIYSSNVYYVSGVEKDSKSKSTLIDVGRDMSIIGKINKKLRGKAEKRIDQVILTHSHFDHAGLLPDILKMYGPEVYANSVYLEKKCRVLRHNEKVRIGDKYFTAIHVRIHSDDSICLFCEEEGILFSGDTPIVYNPHDVEYDEIYISMLEMLSVQKDLKIYPGHGNPIVSECGEIIQRSLRRIQRKVV